MKGSDIRKKFLSFFEKKGHTVVDSSSLVPLEDPTILFTNAGMNQFKECFLGTEKRAYTRAATSQKCLRISGKHNDFENVGVTRRHHTFFEMLGNFSFGDYFKADAITYAWEFVTRDLGLPKSRLWVSIFEDDEESKKLWSDLTDVDTNKIVKMSEKDNFWSMGETGPCGPCSEIYCYIGEDEKKQSLADFLKDDGSYLEIWNLVFMQFEKTADGKLHFLPKPSIDTGMGLERVASILQKEPGNYESDLLKPVITYCEGICEYKYIEGSYLPSHFQEYLDYSRQLAFRVIADHSRSAAFLIADGVMPGNEGRGYALRRIIRRALRHGRCLNFQQPFINQTALQVVKSFSEDYPELSSSKELIRSVLLNEEKKFLETLDAGMDILEQEIVKKRLSSSSKKLFSGETAFLLHDTYGFPVDLTEDALKQYGLRVDTAKFEEEMNKQKSRSREVRKQQNITFVSQNIKTKKTVFKGYDVCSLESEIIEILNTTDNKSSEASESKQEVYSIITAETPFYAESGGQVGDTGTFRTGSALLQVFDTQKLRDNVFVHHCYLEDGNAEDIRIGASALLDVDQKRRNKIRSNHSATHILNAALRNILGTHVKQAGSRVDEKSLRFDFSHFSPMSIEELTDIEKFINRYLRENYEVVTKVLPIQEARELGATALFGEKYGEIVRVVEIGKDSVEFCGGTHADRSGSIGYIHILYEASVSSGVRRIECVAGDAFDSFLNQEILEKEYIKSLLKGDSSTLTTKIERVLEKNKHLEKELKQLQSKLAAHSIDDMLAGIKESKSGHKYLVTTIPSANAESLKDVVDTLRVKINSGIVILASEDNFSETATLVAGATSDISTNIHIGNMIKEVLNKFGGKGGGRADFAQAGIEKISLQKVLKCFEEQISKY
jgi:alanyl-tRNA synthetase